MTTVTVSDYCKKVEDGNMIIKTKSCIAIAALIDVAAHEAERPVSLAGVAERRGISMSYLEQLFRRLRLRGIVDSFRGPGGGYRLNQHLATITVADIVAAVDDENPDSCDCPEVHVGDVGKTHSVWCQVNRHLHHYLKTVTLISLIKQCDVKPTVKASVSLSPQHMRDHALNPASRNRLKMRVGRLVAQP
jgi:Rrf2 family transcriptional regulator, iron-sulfur cluster assembly transcription factor